MDSAIRKWISELANDVNAVSPDTRISKRYLFEKIVASTNYYIRQIPLIELIRNSTSYNTIKCFPMETVPSIECCSFTIPNCKTVQRSINEVPDSYGQVLGVYTLDDDAYTVVTSRKFKNITEDSYYRSKDRYAWIENKHLIIPNSDVEAVKIGGYFINPIKAQELSCEGIIDDCYSPLDEPFNIPDKIKNIVMRDALQSVLTKIQIPKDENTNANSNIK